MGDKLDGYGVQIINMRDEKPCRDFDFKVDRTSPLGCPFKMMREEDRNGVISRYEKWFNKVVANPNDYPAATLYLRRLMSAYRNYGIVRLFCWCAPLRCHAEVIQKYIELKFDEEQS